ncbi:glycosyltransferase family 2 protein [Flavobacterium sp. LM4]|uniref:glycosyltransferase family 2 protein n=1 Tax=Flavobacterium sp. LM4 TaxID=1938609 RepID=UPI000994454A|nr:glycosyltransferase family 2 protein [Flavobacterium sp. LM4]OOV20681.1 hypothetical protein BXU10_01280 [Flavobacterium sp. LM4]
MRIGFNPNKNQENFESDYFHQVVIPVYIPHQEGYFKDSFEILKVCLQSLFKTIHDKTFITIVSNGSSVEINNYLNDLFLQGIIHEIIITNNIGKTNAVLKGIVGHDFPIITVSDADVLFLSNWQSSTYDVFECFPKTGVVCPTPSSRSLRTYTANFYWDVLFSKNLKFSKVKNSEALKMFALSVGNAKFYNEAQLRKYLTISNENCQAVVGAGHFVATYRGDIFDTITTKYSKFKLGGDSLGKVLDIPVVKNGFWRLSTHDNYAYHMGNVLEDWMQVEINTLQKNDFSGLVILSKKSLNSNLSYFIKSRLFSKFILNKKIMPYFFIYKGLSKSEAKEYLT